MPKLLQVPGHQGWSHFQRLLVALLRLLEPYLRNAELTEAVRFLYKGTLRVLLGPAARLPRVPVRVPLPAVRCGPPQLHPDAQPDPVRLPAQHAVAGPLHAQPEGGPAARDQPASSLPAPTLPTPSSCSQVTSDIPSHHIDQAVCCRVMLPALQPLHNKAVWLSSDACKAEDCSILSTHHVSAFYSPPWRSSHALLRPMHFRQQDHGQDCASVASLQDSAAFGGCQNTAGHVLCGAALMQGAPVVLLWLTTYELSIFP